MANIRKSFNFRDGFQVDNDNFVVNANGLVGIGTSTPSEYYLNVYGNKGLRVTGLATVNNVYAGELEVSGATTVGFITANSAHISGILTVNQIDLGSGALGSFVGYAITDAWIAPDSVGLVTTRRIGIGTDVTPDQQLGVVGDVNITGITTSNSLSVTNVATATTFSGSGAQLTDIPNSATTATHLNNNSTIVSRDSSGNFNAGIITATKFVGDVTGDVTGNVTGTAQNLTGSPAITVASVNATGIITSLTRVLTPSIGVGTESPNADIHIRNSGITSVQLTSDSSYSTLRLGKSVSPSSNNGEIRYGYNNLNGSYPYSTSQSLDIINYGADNLNFYLNPSGLGTAFNWLTNASNRAMVLTQSGNLGINSTSPTEKLTVGGGATITGNLSVDGTITGSGANLTNLPAGELTGSLPAIDGSNLLNLTAVGSGINIEDNGSSVGAAVTIINFDSGLNVVASTGIVTVTSSAGSASTENIITDSLKVLGITTTTNKIEIRSNDATPGRVDYYCEVNDAHFTRLQAAPHSEYSGNPTVVLPTISGDMLIGDTSSAITQNVNTTGIITAGSFVKSGGTSSQFLMADGSVSTSSGVAIKDSGAIVGTAATINFGNNLSVSPVSAGIVTVTASGGSSYTNSDVDSHLNQSNPTDGYVLSWTSGDYAWVSQSGGGGSLQSRTTVTGTTASIGVGDTANLTVTAAKSYILHKVGVSTAAWVRIYTDSTNRTADAGRAETADPAPGSGVIAEAITTGVSTTVLMTPGVIGFNNDSTPSSNAYLTVTNKGTTTQTIDVTLTFLQLEA